MLFPPEKESIVGGVRETKEAKRRRDRPQEGSNLHRPLQDEYRTPPDVARLMVELLPKPKRRVSVLEPSASHGNIIQAINATWGQHADKYAIDIQRRYRKPLKELGCRVKIGDFLTLRTRKRFDWVIGNPPFSKGVGTDHILKAWGLIKPGGSVVMLLPLAYLESNDRFHRLWTKTRLRFVWVCAERPKFEGPGGKFAVGIFWWQKGYRDTAGLKVISIRPNKGKKRKRRNK